MQQVEIGAGGGQELYALSDVGVLRSQDGGATWQLGGEGLREVTMGDIRPLQLLADPDRPGSLYATVFGIGVFRSFDDGAHWHPAANRGLGSFPKPSDLEVAPNQPSKLFLATGDWIFVSEDGGDSWTATGPAPPKADSVYDLAIDPTDPDTLYAVGKSETLHDLNPFAFKSQDGGASWERLDIETALGFNVFPTTVTVIPGGSGAVYVVGEPGEIIRSMDGGATWTRADNGLPIDNEHRYFSLRGLATRPSEPSTLYVSLDSSDGLPPRGVYRTIDGGDHWEPVGEWPDDQPAPRDFAFPPEDPSSVLAAPGPYLSPSPPGTAWRSRRPRLPAYSRFVTPHPSDPDILFTATYPPDLLWTTDGGATWRPFARTLPVSPGGALDLVVDPNAPQTLYALGGNPYKSTDGGLTWEEKADGLDSSDGLLALVIDPQDSERLYGWDVSALFGTRNGGETWSPLFEGGDDTVFSLAVDPTDTDVLYLGTATFEGPDNAVRVCRSNDAGSTWNCVDTGLPDGYVSTLQVDPGRPDHIFGVWNRGSFRPGEIVRSLDGGATWSVTSGELPAVRIVDLSIRPGAGSTTLWAATDGRGVYRSADGGDSWVPVRTGLGSLEVNELSSGPGGLYAATALGNYRLDESPGAGEPLPPDDVPWVEDPALPGFRIKTRIDQGGGVTIPGTEQPSCIPETVCFSGALPGRAELFVRIVGPKPNGWLWPTLVKFSTSRIEVWIEQESTDRLRYYELPGARPGFDELPGLFDRFGFPVVPGAP